MPRAALTDSAFSPDGEQLATASLDGTVRVWDVESGTQLKVIKAEPERWLAAALGVTFSPQGQVPVTSWADGKMRLFRRDGDDWKPVAAWPGSAFRLTPQLFDKDERFVVTPNAGLLRVKGDPGSVQCLGRREPRSVQKMDSPRRDLARWPTWPSTRRLATSPRRRWAPRVRSSSGTSKAYRQIGPPIHHPAGVERLAFNPDGTSWRPKRRTAWPALALAPPRRPGAQIQPSLIGSLSGLTGPSPVLAFSSNGSHLISDGGYLATDAGATIGQVWQLSGKTSRPRSRPARPGRVPGVPRRRHARGPVAQPREPTPALVAQDGEKGEPLGSCRGPNLVPTAAALCDPAATSPPPAPRAARSSSGGPTREMRPPS